jgi:hypothetical protein
VPNKKISEMIEPGTPGPIEQPSAETPQDGAGQPARRRARSAASNGKAPASKRSRARSAPPRPSPPAEPELTEGMLGRWRWQLGATARKVAATQARANAALADWEHLVADAATAGVPERLVVAAAADAGIDPL